MTINEVFKQYSIDFKHEYRGLKILYTEVFIKFCSERNIDFKDIAPEIMEDFKNHIMSVRMPQGVYFRHDWCADCYRFAKYFLEWCVKCGFLNDNPLKHFNNIGISTEFEKLCNERVVRNRAVNLGKYGDDRLIKLYSEHQNKNYGSPTTARRHELGVWYLMKYLKERQFCIRDFKDEHLSDFQDWLHNYEIFCSKKISDKTFIAYCFCVRVFYRWLYEEGHLETERFKDMANQKLIAWLEEKRRQREESLKKPSRYYNHHEIIIAYKKYLKKTYSHYSDATHGLYSLNFYIRFLVSRGKTVYSADEAIIEEFKKYTLDYEYQPGFFFKPSFQADRINEIKRFYDWFVFYGYYYNQPLKNFKMSEYIRSIEEYCKTRQGRRNSPEVVPKQFAKVYESVMEYEKRLELAPGTIIHHEHGFRVFFGYLDKIGRMDMLDVDEQDLNEYQNYLMELRTSDNRVISLNTRVKYLVALKRLFRYLAKFKYMNRDLSGCIEFPKNPKGLPTVGITDREARKLIECIDPGRENYIRDRAIIETLYSTGVRSNELRHIRLNEIDMLRGFVRVNKPKGGASKQRVVSIGKLACFWINKYIKEVRSRYKDLKTDILFLNRYGNPLATSGLLNMVKSLVMKAGIKKDAVTHSWRVACATELLKGNANIKYVQQQLGHASIDSTEKYLRLVPGDLKSIHAKCHPREKRNIVYEFEAEVIPFGEEKTTETNIVKVLN